MENGKKRSETQGFFINFGKEKFDVLQDNRRVGRAYLEYKKHHRSSLRLRVQIYARTRSGKVNKYRVTDRYTVRLSIEAMASLLSAVEERQGPIRKRYWRPEVHG